MDSLRSSVDAWSTREESSASFLVCWGLWGRIFCFLVGDTLGVLESLGKALLLPHRRYFRCTWFIGDTLGKNLLPPPWGWCLMCLNHWGRVFYFFTEDGVLDALVPLGKNLLLPYLGIVFLILYDLLEIVLEYTCFIGGRVFYFLYHSLGSPLMILCLIGAILSCFPPPLFFFFERRKFFFTIHD